jgi:predicted PurR-regulated permease PerM
MDVELLGALLSLQHGIDRFNQSSTDLVNTTNRLTKWILGLTITAIIVGVLNAVPTWLLYMSNR